MSPSSRQSLLIFFPFMPQTTEVSPYHFNTIAFLIGKSPVPTSLRTLSSFSSNSLPVKPDRHPPRSAPAPHRHLLTHQPPLVGAPRLPCNAHTPGVQPQQGIHALCTPLHSVQPPVASPSDSRTQLLKKIF